MQWLLVGVNAFPLRDVSQAVQPACKNPAAIISKIPFYWT